MFAWKSLKCWKSKCRYWNVCNVCNLALAKQNIIESKHNIIHLNELFICLIVFHCCVCLLVCLLACLRVSCFSIDDASTFWLIARTSMFYEHCKVFVRCRHVILTCIYHYLIVFLLVISTFICFVTCLCLYLCFCTS